MTDFRTHTLDNGLRLVHCADSTTQMVALNILYRVGARNETPQRTGFAHLFEHLMFGGSKHAPNYDTPLQRAGGENNAWTTNDLTNYYLSLPRENASTAFWLESDRMAYLDLSSKALEVQRKVVMEEFKQRNLNQPYGDMGHLIRALAYTTHPYRWPTIGLELSHIAEATAEDVQEFYETHYSPGNAVLSVTGNISFDQCRELTEHWFGNLPHRPINTTPVPQEPPQIAQRRLEVERDVPINMLVMAFPMSRRFAPDFYIFDLISDLLAGGRSGRLTRRLIFEKPLFTAIDAYVSDSLDDGLFYVTGRLAPKISFAAAEQAVWEELQNLHHTAPESIEIKKAKNKYEVNTLMERMHYLSMAYELAYFEACGGDAALIDTTVDRYRAVTAEEVQRVAQQTFVPERSNIIHYHARKEV